MCDVLVISTDRDAGLRNWASSSLAHGGMSVDSAEAMVNRSRPERDALGTLVAVIPKPDDPARRSVFQRITEAGAARVRVVAVASPDTALPGRIGALHDVVRLGGDPTNATARLLDAVLSPGPFHAIVVPGVHAPTGVAVWMETHVVVSCDDKGIVVAVDAVTGRSTTLRNGLREPHGLWLDRRHLLIAGKGSNRIHVGELVDGRLAPLPDLNTGKKFPLLSPHFAMQFAGSVYVADTDNGRILGARGTVLGRVGTFEQVPTGDLSYPCGLAALDDLLLVADTMNDRVIAVRNGVVVATIEMPAPVQVAVTPDLHLAIVATDGLRLVKVTRRSGDVSLSVLRHDRAGGDHLLRTPFGVAVDRAGRLYVADRGRGVVWSALVGDLLGGGSYAIG